MLIAFVHKKKAFLPAISALSEFFQRYGIETISIEQQHLPMYKPDVEWHLMGIDRHPASGSTIKIHQYNSASVPPFRKLKDRAKKLLCTKPQYRLFLNQYVRDQFSFSDNVATGFLDLGIRDVPHTAATKEFDFIYVGEISERRKLDRLWELFSTGAMRNRTLLVLSSGYESLQQRLQPFKNIQFKGPVPASEVPFYVQKASNGLNLIPNQEPFNSQTSAKFLDYAAAGIPIISSDYSWVRRFEEKYGGAYFFVDDKLDNLSWSNLEHFAFARPNLHDWKWEKQIRSSGVLEFFERKFPMLRFDEEKAFDANLQPKAE